MAPTTAPTGATRKSSRPSTVIAATAAAQPGGGRSKKVKSNDDEDDESESESEEEEASDDEPPKKRAKAAPKPKAVAKAAPVPSIAMIEVGAIVENVELKDENDETVHLHDLVKDQGIIIFTYPKANTPGCTSQACGFRDIYDQIVEAGFKVYGLSTDKPKAQLSWKTSKNFQYSLLSDPDAVLLNHLGASAKTRRCHFVIEKGGKLLEQALGVKPKDDPTNALAFIKAL